MVAFLADALDLRSELALLRAYAPSTDDESIVDLALLFSELRTLSEGGTLAYPYSTRELVKLAQHLERFPDDGIDVACANVFSFDAFDTRLRGVLASVLGRHGVDSGVAFSRAALLGEHTFDLEDDVLVGTPENGIHESSKSLPDQFGSARHLNSGAFAEG